VGNYVATSGVFLVAAVTWGETFGDEVVAAAMIDRLFHHAEILALNGESYRLRHRDLTAPAPVA